MVNAVSAEMTAGETTGSRFYRRRSWYASAKQDSQHGHDPEASLFPLHNFPPFPRLEFLVSLRLLTLPKQFFRLTALFRIVEILILMQGVAVHRQH